MSRVFIASTSLIVVATCLSVPKVHAQASKPAQTRAPEARKWSPHTMRPRDVFELEWAHEPQIDPSGKRIVYARRSFDVMKDKSQSRLWTIDTDGKNHLPLLSNNINAQSPRWSPNGDRLLFLARSGKKSQIFIHWTKLRRTASITHTEETPRAPVWSPDGTQIAFIMSVKTKSTPMVSMPPKPKGAKWAPAAKVVDQLTYRVDGRGYLDESYAHLFVVPSEGGTPRQLTTGNYNHSSPSWTLDGKSIIVSGYRQNDWEHHPLESEIYAVDLASTKVTRLTNRVGPDVSPLVSPNGKHIAYLGFDDKKQGYQVSNAHVMALDGSQKKTLTANLDRSVESIKWGRDSKSLYIKYSDHGNTKIARVKLSGSIKTLVHNVGGTSVGRPYSSGAFSVGQRGQIVYTQTRPSYPADIALHDRKGRTRRLTRLNDDILRYKTLGRVESITVKSSDGLPIQSWVVYPPNFDAKKKYPMILEIHGGPFANYGDRFSTEIQLYASAGFVVQYVNPRGSTSYGEKFGNLIHHAYPGDDYGDLMKSVDAIAAKDFIDKERLFVTGGSGGGVLTAWIVGKTNRFRAAVVAKPVINWTSFSLYADFPAFFTQYWFPAMPWEAPEHYFKRSPLSLVGNVETPTMLLTGESDFRTPIPESEQYYQALKLRKIDAALVRIPGASHGIAARPSHLLAKVLHILAWFDRYDVPQGDKNNSTPSSGTKRAN